MLPICQLKHGKLSEQIVWLLVGIGLGIAQKWQIRVIDHMYHYPHGMCFISINKRWLRD